MARRLRAEGERQVTLVPITTSGDRRDGEPPRAPADKSRFVKEIEEALLRGEIDVAVHSAKDVPGRLPEGLALVGAPEPEDARDALVGVRSLEGLPHAAAVGTGSLRRRSQLLALRPDLELRPLRGNVDTRLAKLEAGDWQAIVLALAGLRRLGRIPDDCAALDPETVVPAPGQGVLVLEAREDDGRIAAAANAISDAVALSRLTAERALVVALDASCHTPLGAHARLAGARLRLDAYVGLPDGSEWMRDSLEGDVGDSKATGEALAARMRTAGADALLERAEQMG